MRRACFGYSHCVSSGLKSMSTGRVLPDQLLDTHIARVLFELQRERRTGLLAMDEGPVQTRLHLEEGRVVFAEEGTVAETLGRLLMKAGTIDRDEYLLILERMSEPSERDEVLRFGEVAISLGMLEPADLNEALAMQVRSKLQRCLQLDDAEWLWVDEPSGRIATPYPTPLEPALLEALRTDPQGYRWVGLLAAKRNRRVTLARTPDEVARTFGARGSELRLLSMIDGRPLAGLLSNRILEPENTGALLVTLLLAGVLEIGRLVSDRAPVRETATETRTKPRDRAPASEEVPPEERARDAAARLREEMRRRRPKPATDSQRVRLDAERMFELGKRQLAQGAMERAIEAFERAASLMPEAADYGLYARWSRYLGEHDPIVRTLREHDLRAAVLEALQQDRTMAFAHYVQARLFLVDGDDKAAERAFSIAARLDPEDLDAMRHLRILRRRRGAD